MIEYQRISEKKSIEIIVFDDVEDMFNPLNVGALTQMLQLFTGSQIIISFSYLNQFNKQLLQSMLTDP